MTSRSGHATMPVVMRVRALGREEVRLATPALVRAFWTFPESVHLLPDERSRRRVLPRYLEADGADATTFGSFFGAEVDGQIVGAAAWLPPDGYPISMVRQLRQLSRLVPVAPWSVGAALEGRRGQAANREAHRGRPRHCWLRAIGVDPSWQGRGVGGRLLRPMLARADAELVGCYLLTATKTNVEWYEDRGFATVAAYHPTPRWPPVWAMWRDPRPG